MRFNHLLFRTLPLCSVLVLAGCSSSETDSSAGVTNPTDGSSSTDTGTDSGTDSGTDTGGTTGDTGLPDGGDSQGSIDTSEGIGFTHSAWTFEESDMLVEIPVSRNDTGEGEVSVSYTAVFDSLSEDELADPISGTLTWADGDTSTKYIRSQIMADLEDEADESFRILLSQPTGAVMADTSSTRVTIESSACNVLSEGTHFLREETTFDQHCYKAGLLTTTSDVFAVSVEAGVTFFLDNFHFSSGKEFSAVGTPDKRIWFRGQSDERDSWDGIYLGSSDSQLNKLEHVVIQNAGGDDNEPAIQLYRLRIALDNVEIYGNGGYGLSIGDEVEFSSFSANTITDNALGAIETHPRNVADFDVLSDYSGNDRDAIDIDFNSTLDQDATWHALNVPISADLLDIDADLVIEPGTVIMMRGATFEITSEGSISAVGTSDQPIVFRGEEATANYWSSLRIESNTVKNKLEYVTISHAGSASNDFYAPLSLNSSGRVDAKSITITDSLGYGVYVGSGNVFANFDPAEFTFINVAKEPYINIR